VVEMASRTWAGTIWLKHTSHGAPPATSARSPFNVPAAALI